jgi:neutral amino acid transport system ATP-binding protein
MSLGTDPSQPILVLEDVVKGFGGLRAVDGASFAVAAGSITALIGPNGAGKTTVFDLISGYERPDAGAIRFEGLRVDTLASYRIARRGLVRTFQLTRIFPAMTVRDNMLIGAQEQAGESLLQVAFGPKSVKRAEEAAQARADALLRSFALEQKADDYAGSLSGGQRKLLEFARALMAKPRLVLLDEPMAGVNKALGVRLLDEVERLRRDEGMTFLFIEHDIDIVMRRADHVIAMAEGAVIAEGPPAVVRRDPRLIDAYLGRKGALA